MGRVGEALVGAFSGASNGAWVGVFGGNETNIPQLQQSFEELTELLDVHFQQHAYLLGQRPALAILACGATCTGAGPTPPQVPTSRPMPRRYWLI